MPKKKTSLSRNTRNLAAETMGGNDEIVFHIEWEPDRIGAGLDHLLYNGDLIDDAVPDPELGHVTLTFHRSSAPVHRFQWSLLFAGKKLQNLKAGASINGVEGDLGSAD